MSVMVKSKGLFVVRHIHKFLVFLMKTFMNLIPKRPTARGLFHTWFQHAGKNIVI
jgi:hypothetical protein